MSDLPVGSGGMARRNKIDQVVDEAVTGPKPKAKPAYVKPATPERNSTYSEMEARIYGDKSAKAKK